MCEERKYTSNPPEVQPSSRHQISSKADLVLTPSPVGTTRTSFMYAVGSAVLSTRMQRMAEVRQAWECRWGFGDRACSLWGKSQGCSGPAKLPGFPGGAPQVSVSHRGLRSAKGRHKETAQWVASWRGPGLWHQPPKGMTFTFVITITDSLLSADLGNDVPLVSKPDSVTGHRQSLEGIQEAVCWKR